MQIRAEQPDDIDTIRGADRGVPSRAGRRADGGTPGRRAPRPIPRHGSRSSRWSAIDDAGQVIGHVVCSVPGSGRSVTGLGLGPIGVLPILQGDGVGSALVQRP